MPVDFNQIRAFIEVARQRHLTRAADRLHLSQPAVSGQIKALEEELGVVLFERSSSGMTLTPGGKQLLPRAEEILAATRRLKNAASELSGGLTGKLRVGTMLDPVVLRVGELLALALLEYPHVEIELSHTISSDAVQGVRNGALDAAFYFGPRPDSGIEAVPLREIAYRLAIPAAWKEELALESIDELAARPWIVGSADSSHRRILLRTFPGDGELPPRTVEADNESVVANLIASGVGASLVREEIAQAGERDGRFAVWPGVTEKTWLWLIHAEGREDDPLLGALLDVLRRVWPDAPESSRAELVS
jgi:DNA-binding transcriptional LysR family regulator